MKIADNLLLINSKDGLLIRWSDLPFNLSIAILWRGLYFSLDLHAFRIENGSTRTAIFSYDKKKYSYSLTKWKYMGGHHGDPFPTIKTTTNTLRFHLSLNSLEIVDIQNGSAKNEQGDNSIMVFYQS